jgi:hypothetical protein
MDNIKKPFVPTKKQLDKLKKYLSKHGKDSQSAHERAGDNSSRAQANK